VSARREDAWTSGDAPLLDLVPASTPAAPGCEAATAVHRGSYPGGTLEDVVLCGARVTHVLAASDNEGHCPVCEYHAAAFVALRPGDRVEVLTLDAFVMRRRRAPYTGVCAGCNCAACATARRRRDG